MKVLVTGGAGYIGSVVTEELLNDGREAVVYDSLYKGHPGAVDPRAKFVHADLNDSVQLKAALTNNQIEAVIIPAPSSDLPLTVPVNWVGVGGCVVHGTFKVGLNPGAYSLTIGSCYLIRAAATFLNDTTCSGLPKTVLVESGTWTQVEISITTGIY